MNAYAGYFITGLAFFNVSLIFNNDSPRMNVITIPTIGFINGIETLTISRLSILVICKYIAARTVIKNNRPNISDITTVHFFYILLLSLLRFLMYFLSHLGVFIGNSH